VSCRQYPDLCACTSKVKPLARLDTPTCTTSLGKSKILIWNAK
jgi:hypothetical protein